MKKIISLATVAIIMFITSFSASAQRGYRGFADGVLGVDINDGEAGFAGGISTVHGYQINHWFVGGGLSLLNSSLSFDKNTLLPIYAQVRYDYSLISSKSFFALAKGGYDPLAKGAYVGIGAGLRIALNRSISALNIGINFSVREEDAFDDHTDLGEKFTYCQPALTFGIEF